MSHKRSTADRSLDLVSYGRHVRWWYEFFLIKLMHWSREVSRYVRPLRVVQGSNFACRESIEKDGKSEKFFGERVYFYILVSCNIFSLPHCFRDSQTSSKGLRVNIFDHFPLRMKRVRIWSLSIVYDFSMHFDLMWVMQWCFVSKIILRISSTLPRKT